MHVQTLDDAHDDPGETFRVKLLSPHNAVLADGEAIGTILNDDPILAAWLERFGRMVAEQALSDIAERIAAPRTPGVEGVFAGQALGGPQSGLEGGLEDGWTSTGGFGKGEGFAGPIDRPII